MFFQKKHNKPVIDSKGLDLLELHSDKSVNECFGNVQNISKNNTVELSIEVEDNSPPSHEQVELLKRFSKEIESTERVIYKYIQDCFEGQSGKALNRT
ncbi:hypothetical protein EFA69_14790 [Rufibacter immobilis]|uniref:Uncharacterized protein n=1 Tax=Rufibacter immobilis TaxID=1348778 RepID=A0A3M9MR90_9BACT|nr:hypothetical protein EFA69_14790 [Rufibacter immobilis]